MISSARLRETSSAIKILALFEILKLSTTFWLTAAAAAPLLILEPSVYMQWKSDNSSHNCKYLLLKMSGFVSDLTSSVNERSTVGRVKNQGGVGMTEVRRTSFGTKPMSRRSSLTR